MKIKSNLVVTVLVGLAACLAITGPKVLNPSYIDWLMGGDPLQHYLGWAFFRLSDWSFPIGLNPNFGLNISSSVVYSDSIPLLAIFFKFFRAFLPTQFQYFGFWTLACLVLQYWFGQKLVSLGTNNRLIIFLAAGIFLFSPPMLWRIGLHEALVAHFLLLGGLYLNIKINNKWISLKWSILLAIALLVHIYLFSMIFALWLASLLDRAFHSKYRGLPMPLSEFFLIILILGLISWQAGYWISSSSASEWGYGQFRFNLLSPLYPKGWSTVHLIPEVFQDFESFNYIGLGSLLIIIFGAYFSFRSRFLVATFANQHKFLMLALICLLLYATSNNISIGNYVYSISLPDQLAPYLNILRHSNRMFWPVFYALLAGSIFLIIHNIKNVTFLSIFFAAALVLQVFDTSKGWLWLRASLMQPAPP